MEPSYSSRLQSNQFYSNVPPPSNQSLYSNTATLPSTNKLNSHDNNYANLPRRNNEQGIYSRSASAMSNNSLPRSTASYGTGYATKNTR